MARALARIDRLQPELERRYIEDVARITGHAPADWAQADARLEAFVLRAGAEHEDELLVLLHRQLVGLSLLLADRDDWEHKYEWLTQPTPPVHAPGEGAVAVMSPTTEAKVDE